MNTLSLRRKMISVLTFMSLISILIVSIVSIRVMTKKLENELYIKIHNTIFLTDNLIFKSKEQLNTFVNIFAADSNLQVDMSLGNFDEIQELLVQKKSLYGVDEIRLFDTKGMLVSKEGNLTLKEEKII